MKLSKEIIMLLTNKNSPSTYLIKIQRHCLYLVPLENMTSFKSKLWLTLIKFQKILSLIKNLKVLKSELKINELFIMIISREVIKWKMEFNKNWPLFIDSFEFLD